MQGQDAMVLEKPMETEYDQEAVCSRFQKFKSKWKGAESGQGKGSHQKWERLIRLRLGPLKLLFGPVAAPTAAAMISLYHLIS